jgi:hypothetical protein
MPVNVDDFLADGDPEASGGSVRSDSTEFWTDIPESGGPFGGRDATLTSFAGVLRRRRFKLDEALPMLLSWDRQCCKPPLGEAYIKDKLRTWWVDWAQGTEADLTPEEARGEEADLAFLTYEDMAALEKEAGALAWLLDNVLPEGGLVYFSAPPAGAKSWVLLDLVKAFTTGDPWIGKYTLKKTNVLYIDEEMGVRKILPRLRKLGLTDGIDGFWYTDKAGVRFDNVKHVRKILAHCQAHDIKAVFVDTLTRVHNLDENDNSQMRQLFRRFSALMDAGITVMVAHHNRKKGAESDVAHEQMRGAGEIAAMADMAYSIDKAGKVFRLSTSKGRLVAEEDQITIDFAIEDNADRTATVLREVSDTERVLARNSETERRILSALMDGQKNGTELCSAIKGRKADILDAVKRMANDGRIVRSKDGQKVYYSLPGTGREPDEDDDWDG